MHSAFSVICPTCKANISDTDRACGQCGADVSVWPGVGRTPLILPGNPALSEDEVRRRISPLRIVSGTVVGVAALVGALFLTSANESDEPALLYAVGTTSPSAALADSTPASPVALPSAASSLSASTLAPADSTSGARAATPPTKKVPAEPALEPIPAFVVSPTDVATIVPPVKPAAATAARSTKPVTPPPTSTPIAVRSPAPAPPGTVPRAGRAPAVAANARAVVATAGTALPTPVVGSPVLRLTPLVSDSLRPGELLQLRWSVLDRATARPVRADMEFTSTDASVASVDRRTGMVTARKPGRVRIIVDAGAGGETAVALTVRPPATVAVALAPPTASLQARSEAARSTSVIAAPPSAAPPVAPPASPPVTPPVTPSPATTPATTPAATPARDARRDETASDADIRSVVDRVIADIRRSGARNAPIMEFLADGDGHRVAMIGTASSSSAGTNALRVSFEVRLTKFDGGGRPVVRIVPVSLTLDKRDNAVTSSAVSFGALRRP